MLDQAKPDHAAVQKTIQPGSRDPRLPIRPRLVHQRQKQGSEFDNAYMQEALGTKLGRPEKAAGVGLLEGATTLHKSASARRRDRQKTGEPQTRQENRQGQARNLVKEMVKTTKDNHISPRPEAYISSTLRTIAEPTTFGKCTSISLKQRARRRCTQG